MDSIAHGAMGVSISYLIYVVITILLPIQYDPLSTSSIIIWIISFLLGALPDISGFIDGKIRGPEYRWHGYYGYFHHPELYPCIYRKRWFQMLLLVWHIRLHTYIDEKTHNTVYNPSKDNLNIFGIQLVRSGQTSGWNINGYISEIIFWMMFIIFILMIFI